MIYLAVNLVTIAALVALIFLFIRQKGSYFKSVKILLIVAFSAVDSIILASAVKNYVIKEDWIMLPYALWAISAVVVAALAAEHAAFTLYKRQQMSHPKRLFSDKVSMCSVLFKMYAFLILALAIAFTPWWVQNDYQSLWGTLVYGVVFDSWFLWMFGGLMIAFIAYPCAMMIRLSRIYEDKYVSDALRWLGISCVSTATTLVFFQVMTRTLKMEFIEVSSLFNLFYYGIVIYYFRRTTILESFLSITKSSLHLREGEHLVVFYTNKVDKWKLFSTYINQGLCEGDRVIFAYSDADSEIVRSKLEEYGIDVERHEKDGSVVLMSVSHIYMPSGVLNKSQLINFWNDLKVDTKKGGFKHERDLFDLDDLSFLGNQKEKYFEYLREANKELMDPFMVELRAVNVENLSPDLVQEFRFLSTKSMDLLEYSDKFSRRIGVNHKYVIGRNLLLEFDPVSNYEEAILDFVLEASANSESVIVFTNKGGTLHTLLKKQENVKLLLLTNLGSTPRTDKCNEEVLVPASNTSLLLDALNRAVKNHTEGNFNFVFDNLTGLVLQVGSEKTFNFVRYALEILSSRSTTAVFLFNPSAHDQKIASSLRSLFSNQVAFEKGGLEIVKLPEALMEAQVRGSNGRR